MLILQAIGVALIVSVGIGAYWITAKRANHNLQAKGTPSKPPVANLELELYCIEEHKKLENLYFQLLANLNAKQKTRKAPPVEFEIFSYV